jgi:hypothetical protein
MFRLVSGDSYAVGEDHSIDGDNASQSQSALTISALPSGYVAVWIDQTGYNTSAIKAQIFDNFGQPVGSEFLVTNAPGSSGGGQPSVAVLESGDFVVTWTVENPYPGGYDIMGQMFDASGVPSGSEFNANTPVDGFQVESMVTPLAGGGFLVTWLSGSQGGIRAQIFDADADKVGGEFDITELQHAYTRDVVGLSGGGFVADQPATIACLCLIY